MAGLNLATAYGKAYRTASAASSCVFISYRLADRATASAVEIFLTQTAECNVYCSESDAKLKDAVATGSDERLVACIDEGLASSTRLLGIISNQTKGSWWVPYEFGAARQKKLPIALLLTEQVTSLPSYMKVATALRDSDDLVKWAREIDSLSGFRMLQKSASAPTIPGVARYRAAYPTYT